MVIPRVAETLQIGRRTVERERGVRVSKSVETVTAQVDEPVWRDELVVERVARDEAVDAAAPPRPRQEGDTLVLPVLEEVVVTTRSLRLTGEVRITRRRVPERHVASVPLRRERIDTERFGDAASAASCPPAPAAVPVHSVHPPTPATPSASRSRNASHPAPPPQIRACGATAHGSCLGS